MQRNPLIAAAVAVTFALPLAATAANNDKATGARKIC